MRMMMYMILNLRSFSLDKYEESSMWPNYKKVLFRFAKGLVRYLPRKRSEFKNFYFGKVFDVSPEIVKKGDPSEGVRSEEIIPLVKNKFRNTMLHHYNGSILSYALDKMFFEKFDSNLKEDIELFELLTAMEKSLISSGEIPPILSIIVAKKDL
jgi:hypothetical protein